MSRLDEIVDRGQEAVELDWYQVQQLARLQITESEFGDVTDEHQLIMDMQWQVDFDRPLWIQGYNVSRCYGGPEEGGWWYNWYTPSPDMRVRMPNEWLENGTYESVHAVRRHFQKTWERRYSWGDIYSMAGGENVTSFIEYGDWGQHETLHRPRYC